MPPILRFLINRLISIPVTLFVVTAVLYATVMLTPPETRATLYMPKNLPLRMTEEQYQNLIRLRIERYHLDEPYPIQYAFWIGSLLQGTWGYSPVMQGDVLTALVRRTPVTAELTIFSLLFFIPLGLFSGVIAGGNQNRLADHRFRLVAFVATSLPPFILALVLLSIFYVSVKWFPPERISMTNSFVITSPDFRVYTGLLTIDGLLNGRPDISLDAVRHLVLPVVTLSLLHWATLGRVTRASMVEELQKDYVIAARARGIKEREVIWKHTFRNVFAPALTSSTLSAAAIVTGVYVVEAIYNFHGVSELAIFSLQGVPDAAAALGFALYSVIVVLVLMFLLDIIQAILDPRFREGIVTS